MFLDQACIMSFRTRTPNGSVQSPPGWWSLTLTCKGSDHALCASGARATVEGFHEKPTDDLRCLGWTGIASEPADKWNITGHKFSQGVCSVCSNLPRLQRVPSPPPAFRPARETVWSGVHTHHATWRVTCQGSGVSVHDAGSETVPGFWDLPQGMLPGPSRPLD